MNHAYETAGLATVLAALAGPVQAVGALRVWQERARQRAELKRLDDHLLEDIGLTRAQVLAEAHKPFWRA